MMTIAWQLFLPQDFGERGGEGAGKLIWMILAQIGDRCSVSELDSNWCPMH